MRNNEPPIKGIYEIPGMRKTSKAEGDGTLDTFALSEAIRNARTKYFKTQQDFAPAMNTSTRHISDIERGRTVPSVSEIIAICYLCDIDPNTLLSDSIKFCEIKGNHHTNDTEDGCSWDRDKINELLEYVSGNATHLTEIAEKLEQIKQQLDGINLGRE